MLFTCIRLFVLEKQKENVRIEGDFPKIAKINVQQEKPEGWREGMMAVTRVDSKSAWTALTDASLAPNILRNVVDQHFKVMIFICPA